jgi:hypothetical protein
MPALFTDPAKHLDNSRQNQYSQWLNDVSNLQKENQLVFKADFLFRVHAADGLAVICQCIAQNIRKQSIVLRKAHNTCQDVSTQGYYA